MAAVAPRFESSLSHVLIVPEDSLMQTFSGLSDDSCKIR